MSLLPLILWTSLVAAAIAAGVLLKTKWGREQPMRGYALVSIVAHLALVCMATTIRMVTTPGGAPPKPVAVEIVLRSPAKPQAAKVEPKKTVKPKAPENKPEPKPTPPKPVVKGPAATVVVPPPAPVVEPAPVEAPPVEPIIVEAAPEPQVGEAWVTGTPATGEELPFSSPFADRTNPDRVRLAQEKGGSQQTEDAVATGLAWLIAAQSADGRWDADRWDAGREAQIMGHNRGGAGAKADTGVTALALLALLGAGHTHQTGPYQPQVAAGLNFLMQSQAADGSLAGEAEFYARTYCHSMATFALAEALAVTNDRRLEPAVRAGCQFLIAGQHPATGGWRYRPGDPGDRGDMSQLGWIVMALRSAELSGIEVPSRTWAGVDRFLQSVAMGPSRGLACYQPGGPPTRTMTAEALYSRLVRHTPLEPATITEATNSVVLLPPGQGQVNLYYWYYGTLALHHARATDPRSWKRWNNELKTVLTGLQAKSGPLQGSWDPDPVWGHYGGRVYSTALSVMCLEVYYRYADGNDTPWLAERPTANR